MNEDSVGETMVDEDEQMRMREATNKEVAAEERHKEEPDSAGNVGVPEFWRCPDSAGNVGVLEFWRCLGASGSTHEFMAVYDAFACLVAQMEPGHGQELGNQELTAIADHMGLWAEKAEVDVSAGLAPGLCGLEQSAGQS